MDASAVLAVLFQEPGRELVKAAIAEGAGVCTINLAEIVSRIVRNSVSIDVARRMVTGIGLDAVDLDVDLAYRAAEMITLTRPFGLSLGDRCCLALAAREGVPAVTADRDWAKVGQLIGVDVILIR